MSRVRTALPVFAGGADDEEEDDDDAGGGLATSWA